MKLFLKLTQKKQLELILCKILGYPNGKTTQAVQRAEAELGRINSRALVQTLEPAIINRKPSY